MCKILNEQELEKFMKDNKVECYSIIIRVDVNAKKASYVIDGEKIIPLDYENALKYFDI